MVNYNESPLHPNIDQPHQFQIVRFDYRFDPDDWRNSFIDLVLRRGPVTRRLRFHRPQNLKIEEGFPLATGGLQLLDISHRQLDGLTVEVADFEATPGAITFYAANVIDLDKSDPISD
ncbi:hypothetical protein ETAA8_59670 [Anatilimnocola aggregata]|uniref:Uncharacterized protein n=1 Tax=Anatilimnocola aggregata TaxID=2528021 RepID=A0A517YKU2_9BACT|nr:hypothetical protein [Anatilimnocola aggregata]QDU30818.1 hypothetical protein ETAA8_59670 [Anatilimnocola aggregata]